MGDFLAHIRELDERLFASLNRFLHADAPAWTEAAWSFANGLGTVYMLLLVMGLVGVLSTRWRDAVTRMAVLLLVQGTTAACVGLIKVSVARPRPRQQLAQWLADGKWSEALGAPGTLHSFPSGHTALAAGLGATLVAWAFCRLDRPRALGCALCVSGLCVAVGLARVYAGAHYPLDVVAGALVGILSAGLVLWACSKFLMGPLQRAIGKRD